MASREQWQARFAAGTHSQTEPANVVIASRNHWPPLREGVRRALDVASGAGRNAVYLAEAGFHAEAVDWAQAGLDALQQRAMAKGLAVECRVLDLESDNLELGGPFDLVVCVDFLHRPLFAKLRAAVRPGGLIVYETYLLEQKDAAGGPSSARFLLEPNELLKKFEDWRILRYEETPLPTAKASLIAQAP